MAYSTTKVGMVILLTLIIGGCNTAENSTTAMDSTATIDEKVAKPAIAETKKAPSAPQTESAKSAASDTLKLSLPQDFAVEDETPKSSVGTAPADNLFAPTNQDADKVKISAKPMTNIDKNDWMNSRIEGGTLSVEIKTD